MDYEKSEVVAFQQRLRGIATELHGKYPQLPEELCHAAIGAVTDSMLQVLAINFLEEIAEHSIVNSQNVGMNCGLTWRKVLSLFVQDKEAVTAIINLLLDRARPLAAEMFTRSVVGTSLSSVPSSQVH